MPQSGHVWLLVVLLSVAGRLAIAPFTGHPYDLDIWMETGRQVAEGKSPYELQNHLGYPPPWGLWCGLSYVLSNSIWPGNEFLYIFTIKIPILAADFGIAYMLLKSPRYPRGAGCQASSKGIIFGEPTSGRSLATLFLLNPYVLTVGVVWGMMDNLAALLVTLVALALSQGNDVKTGVFLGLAIALKLYPVLFLPVLLLYLAQNDHSRRRALHFLAALVFTVVGSVFLPFLVLGWDVGSFLNMLLDQTSRRPGGISPIGVLGLLSRTGVENLGPFDVQSLFQLPALRLLWVPAVSLSSILIARARPRLSFGSTLNVLALVFIVWILTAPWVSEQNVETLLVLILFRGACSGFDRLRRWSYGFASSVVLVFAFFDVPATSFVYPVCRLDSSFLEVVGKQVLPWISIVFAAWAILEAKRTAMIIKSGRESLLDPVNPHV